MKTCKNNLNFKKNNPGFKKPYQKGKVSHSK